MILVSKSWRVGCRDGLCVAIQIYFRSPRMQLPWNEKAAEARRQGCLVPSVRKNWVAYVPAKANALLNWHEELPQYDKGTLERSIEH